MFYALKDQNQKGKVSERTLEVIVALTAKQKKLPKALQRAILAKQKGMGKKKKKNGKKKKGGKKKRSTG